MNEYLSKTTTRVITLIGLLLLIIGIIAAIVGPFEFYCYYLFTEGGRFHYEGFGFGSFMFGNITMQIWGYYIIALICIPLGYGHLKKNIWIQKISLTLLYVWVIVGIPILPIIFFIIVTSKEPSLVFIVLSAIFCLLSYTLIPALLIKFYKSKSVEMTLKKNEKKYNFIDKYPISLIMTLILYVFYIYAFHVLLLFQGIFPFFGQWLTDFKGIIFTSLSILFFIVLIIGTLNRKLWSWWISFCYFCFFISSSIITLLLSDFSEIVTLLNFPPTETKALINIPLKGFHLSVIFGIPLIITLGVIIFSRKYFIVFKESRITSVST